LLAVNIKYLRENRNETQQQIANSIGISRASLIDYEKGKSEPSLSTLKALAKHFHVSLDKLVHDNLVESIDNESFNKWRH